VAKKCETVANYSDPVRGPTGWGHPDFNLIQKTAIEESGFERLGEMSNVKLTFGSKQTTGAPPIDPVFEQVIRSKFQFDEGWDFMVAERMCYNLSPEETLMVVQLIGICVGASHCALFASRYAHEIVAIGDAEEPFGRQQLGMPFWPYSYGVGRLVGGILHPSEDGSYCSSQMEGTLKYGVLPCFVEGLEKYAGRGHAALPQGTAKSGRLFGGNKKEIEKWTDKAVHFQMVEAPIAKTADDAKSLMVEKHTPLLICSAWAFKYKGFDTKYGVHLYERDRDDEWHHAMQLVAMFAIKGQWFVAVRNQWGYDAHKGSPEIGIPGGCMVLTFEEFAKWIRGAEVMGIGEIVGLPSNPVV
jgi:hypothetical protein